MNNIQSIQYLLGKLKKIFYSSQQVFTIYHLIILCCYLFFNYYYCYCSFLTLICLHRFQCYYLIVSYQFSLSQLIDLIPQNSVLIRIGIRSMSQLHRLINIYIIYRKYICDIYFLWSIWSAAQIICSCTVNISSIYRIGDIVFVVTTLVNTFKDFSDLKTAYQLSSQNKFYSVAIIPKQ